MPTPIRAAKGLFAGSIGDGKGGAPTPAPVMPSRCSKDTPETPPVVAAYSSYMQTAAPSPLVTLTDVNGQSADLDPGDLWPATWFLTNGNFCIELERVADRAA